MKRYVLTQPVVIPGVDFWGRKAQVTLSPTSERGWFLNVESRDAPITPRMLMTRKNRLVLQYGGYEYNVAEHLLALRFLLGLDNISIRSETTWFPYDGCARMFYDACLPYVREAGELERYTVSQPYQVVGDNKKKAGRITFSPSSVILKLEIYVNYAGLGTWWQEWKFPGGDSAELAYTYTQGWPRWRYPAAWILSSRLVPKKIRWPHFHHVVWPQRVSRPVALKGFAMHRALDLPGALAVACPPGGILTGVVYSECAGHWHDVEVVHSIAPHLQKVGKPALRIAG